MLPPGPDQQVRERDEAPDPGRCMDERDILAIRRPEGRVVTDVIERDAGKLDRLKDFLLRRGQSFQDPLELFECFPRLPLPGRPIRDQTIAELLGRIPGKSIPHLIGAEDEGWRTLRAVAGSLPVITSRIPC